MSGFKVGEIYKEILNGQRGEGVNGRRGEGEV
jgi:hypothetical protein